MQYQIRELDEDTLNLTEKSWSEQVDEDIFEIELKNHLIWAKDHISYKDPSQSSFAYGIFRSDSPDPSPAEAIVEIIQSPTGLKMTKLLKLITAPRLWDDSDVDAMSDLLDVTTAAFEGTLDFGFKNQSKIFKYYGRNSSLLQVLVSVNKRLNQQINDPSSQFHGKISSRIVDRWLEIKLNINS